MIELSLLPSFAFQEEKDKFDLVCRLVEKREREIHKPEKNTHVGLKRGRWALKEFEEMKEEKPNCAAQRKEH